MRVISLFAAAGILVVTAFIFGPAQAQTATQQQAAPSAPRWIVTCNNRPTPDKLSCFMSYVLTIASSNRRIASVTIRPHAENPEIVFLLPHGLNLQEGVGFAIDDGSAERISIQTADANGAYTRIALTKERILALRAGNQLKLNVTGSGERDIRLEFSLNGFAKAYDLMK